ncbi:hypothetical protein LMG24235_00902 [Paraburkholderia sabiae]|nr:hypothetical protein LMG24235_00902 [Paraburkholderia sabiae]
MDLKEAFAAVRSLAREDRLLIGHGCIRYRSGNCEALMVDWEAEDIRDNGELYGPRSRIHFDAELIEILFKGHTCPALGHVYPRIPLR